MKNRKIKIGDLMNDANGEIKAVPEEKNHLNELIVKTLRIMIEKEYVFS